MEGDYRSAPLRVAHLLKAFNQSEKILSFNCRESFGITTNFPNALKPISGVSVERIFC